MKKLLVFITFAAIFGIGGATHAATLYTAPLEMDFVDNQDLSLVCTAANVSQWSRTITIDIININGVSIANVSDTVQPGARLGVTQGSDNGNATPSHCKVEVNGDKSSVRASACIFQVGVGCITALPAF